MDASLVKWFIIQVKPNSYEMATTNLKRQGFQTFVPTVDITKRYLNKFFVKNVYLFPGYMFVAFNPSLISWSKINSTYGVSKILIFSGKPAEVPFDLILTLKQRCNHNDVLVQNNQLKIGDKIKISKGPFTDFIGKVENINENKRIYVFLEYMGQRQKVRLRYDNKVNYNKV